MSAPMLHPRTAGYVWRGETLCPHCVLARAIEDGRDPRRLLDVPAGMTGNVERVAAYVPDARPVELDPDACDRCAGYWQAGA